MSLNKKQTHKHQPKSMSLDTERLQKVMARAGLGSRRGLESEIEAGRVQVNATVATLGQQVSAGDVVTYQGKVYKTLPVRPSHRTLMYHKPEGQITTRHDPEGRKTVFDHLPTLKDARWIAVGRLDINTAGLLLLTTDGELANQMMHPSNQVDREYLCRIRGHVTEEQIEQLQSGVELEDGPAKFSDLVVGETTQGHTWVTVTLLEGRNREVRRLWEAVGAQVARLKRVRFGPVFLPGEDAGLARDTSELTLVSEKGAKTSAARSNTDNRKQGNRRRH